MPSGVTARAQLLRTTTLPCAQEEAGDRRELPDLTRSWGRGARMTQMPPNPGVTTSTREEHSHRHGVGGEDGGHTTP